MSRSVVSSAGDKRANGIIFEMLFPHVTWLSDSLYCAFDDPFEFSDLDPEFYIWDYRQPASRTVLLNPFSYVNSDHVLSRPPSCDMLHSVAWIESGDTRTSLTEKCSLRWKPGIFRATTSKIGSLLPKPRKRESPG